MKDADCVEFLQWALPRLNMRWVGFRKVRRQVCKRISRRMKELDIQTIGQFRERLEEDPDEWLVLDAACRITISRFCRDRHVFDELAQVVLPDLFERALKGGRPARCWCAGCASGEEAYTLAILWNAVLPPVYRDVGFDIVGTDADPVMIARAEKACYSRGALKDIPEDWLSLAFNKVGVDYCIRPAYRRNSIFQLQDIRNEWPSGKFDLILCRNLAFTYFAPDLQQSVLDRIKARLRPSGYLVIGAHEALPESNTAFEPLTSCREVLHYRLACRPMEYPT